MSLFEELKRRNVIRVAVAYGVIAWVLAQVADLAFDNFGAPEWVSKSILFVLVLGFPLAVFFAWAFELTPEGIKKEKDVDRTESITSTTGKKLNSLIIAVLVVAVGFLLIDRVGTDEQAANEDVVITEGSKLSIAVLPFDNRSNRDEDEFFTEGIHDDLLTTIANIGSLKVISRTSVMQYKDTTKKLPEIAQELGVANILEGGIQRSGNQVRINVQLIDAKTDEHLWAEIYDRQLTAENLFAIQSEVSKAIATALQATLSPEEAERIIAVPTDNLEAYELFLRGRQRWTTRTAASTAEAVELFLDAIELDPEFAEAWAGLGDAYRHQEPYGGLPGNDVFPKAEAAIRKALELDPDLAEAHAGLGGLISQKGDDKAALQHFERAIELNPSYSPAYNWLGMALYGFGEYDKAEVVLRKGLDIDPLSAVLTINLAYTAGMAGQHDQFKARLERGLELHPESAHSYVGLSVYQNSILGRLDQGLLWQIGAVLADPNDTSTRVWAGWILDQLGEYKAADRWIESAFALQPDSLDAHLMQMYLQITRGQIDEATGSARRLYENREGSRIDVSLLELLASADIAADDAGAALQRYQREYPQVAGPETSPLLIWDISVAMDTIRLLRETGQDGKADELLAELISLLEAAPVLGLTGSAGGLAAAYMIAGRKADALAKLQSDIDAGWRSDWRYLFDYHWSLEPLRDNPEFQSMRMELAADMEKQLENVRRMQASGEMPVVPGMEPLRQPEKAGPPPT